LHERRMKSINRKLVQNNENLKNQMTNIKKQINHNNQYSIFKTRTRSLEILALSFGAYLSEELLWSDLNIEFWNFIKTI